MVYNVQVPPGPEKDIRQTKAAQEILRAAFFGMSKAHGLSHETRKELAERLGLVTREELEAVLMRLEEIEGRARRMGLLPENGDE